MVYRTNDPWPEKAVWVPAQVADCPDALKTFLGAQGKIEDDELERIGSPGKDANRRIPARASNHL